MSRLLGDDAGTATVDFVISLPVLLGVLAAASELGNALRIKAALDSAVRDAARIASITPIDNSGVLMTAGVTVAHDLVVDRLAAGGFEVLFAPVDDANAVCRNNESPCVSVAPIANSVAVFGEQKYTVTMAARITLSSPVLSLLSLGAGDGDFETITLSSSDSQVHYE